MFFRQALQIKHGGTGNENKEASVCRGRRDIRGTRNAVESILGKAPKQSEDALLYSSWGGADEWSAPPTFST